MSRVSVPKATTAIVSLLVVFYFRLCPVVLGGARRGSRGSCAVRRLGCWYCGGLDIGLTRHIALRVFEADYYLTRFDNGVNDHQNNLRIAAGVIIRFGGSR